VEYSLSETGKELIPFIMYLNKWGEKQMAKIGGFKDAKSLNIS
jgi:DNA-binding HxlR family transcriptional regulator